jgi:glucose/arabinose dehydrogenase/mono/diheme cytochrome c family protein
MLKHVRLLAALSVAGMFVFGPDSAFAAISERKPNTTLNFPQTLPSTLTNNYTTENAFTGLTFAAPIALATAPGETNRLYVAELAGRIQVITNLLTPTKTEFFNLTPFVNGGGEGGLLGLAFHPNYVSNRQFFVFYTRTATNGTGTGYHTRLSRFERTATNQNEALANTEVVLYSQFNDQNNHNGGDIHFGPDGYLYVGVGDEGGGGDFWNNAQIIDKDFFSGMLRIDVDKKPGSLAPNHHPALGGVTNYAIPPDNPFIGVTNYYGSNVVPTRVRTEFFAVGLRNPFRFSIDPISSLIYVGDVGQNLWEEVNLVTNGGNYGWAAREGFVNGSKPGIFGATNYANPMLVYGRGTATNQGNSITGGRVYRGDRFPELVGKYIFADYGSGHIWALTHNGTNSTSFAWLATDPNIVAFGAHPNNGDMLFCDLITNQVRRLVYSTPGTNALPVNLSDTGIFSDLATLTPNEGIIPYSINVPFWSDHAIKRRWFSLPNTNLHLEFNTWGTWNAPTTSVWIKHFDLELTSGVPASVRRIETRVMVRNSSPAGGYGLTYRWGNSSTNAVLIPVTGLDEEILINDNGIIRTQVWRYPSRGACQTCHNQNAGFTLSFNTPQMNMVYDFGDITTNQIAALANAGYFSGSVSNVHLMRKLAHPTNTEFSVAYRARSYLESNCSQCHRPGGPVPAAFDARIQTPLSASGIIDGALADDYGNEENRVIRRGSPFHSMTLTRINTRSIGQMPPLGSTVIDTQAVALITAWITGEAADYETYAEWQERHFGSTNAPGTFLDDDFDGDGSNNEYEYLTGSQPTNHLDAWEYTDLIVTGSVPALAFDRAAHAGFDVQVSTSLVDGAWFSLDVPENAPVYGAAPIHVTVPDPDATNLTERFYRVRAYEP